MEKVLSGKVAIVTGGASGLGLGIAEKFIAVGARVVIADIDREQGESVAAACGPDAWFRYANVSSSDDMHSLINATIDKFGGLNVMVNNAAVPGSVGSKFLDIDLGEFNHVMGVNLLGVMLGTQLAARHMASVGGGSIINLSSLAGIRTGGPVLYSASKTAVIGFTEVAASALGDSMVRVNCIAPAHIETPILSKAIGDMPSDKKAALIKSIREGMVSRQPLQVQGEKEDVSEAAVFLASDKSKFITGALLTVDGGASLGAPNRNAEQVLRAVRR